MTLVRRTLALGAAGALVLALGPAAAAAPPAGKGGKGGDLGRQVLGANDGWASAEGGTTGGAAATAEHVYHVDTWDEFRAALGGSSARGDTTPRIVYVHGMLDAQLREPDGDVDCAAYAADGWDFDAYTADFEAWVAAGNAPDDWEAPDDLEAARVASNRIQDAQVRQYVGSNVTIVGVGKDAGITGASLTVRDSENVIIRNLHLSDAYDCFPEWDPGDAGGTWNAEFDNLWIATSRHVWVDHNTFDDGDNPPSALPTVLGAKFEVHDGLLDITNGSDLVTVSWNVFSDHDKVSLIGSTNNPRLDPVTGQPTEQSDLGRLRITFHHNLYENTGQRTPRVRYGDVHVYNNYYRDMDPELFQYSWGVGVGAEILAENNYVELPAGIDASEFVADWRGSARTYYAGLEERGSLLNGRSPRHRVSFVDAYNAVNDPDIPTTVGFEPPSDRIDPTQSVPGRVSAQAGAGHLR